MIRQYLSVKLSSVLRIFFLIETLIAQFPVMLQNLPEEQKHDMPALK